MTYECSECGKEFNELYEIGAHSNKVHKDSGVEVKCKVCGEVFDKVPPSEKDKYSYCSSECRKKYFNENSEKFNLFEEGHEGYDSSPWQGKSFSKKHKEAISQALQGITRSKEYIEENLQGENHWNWQGGKSFVEYPASFNDSLKRRVRERDGFECVNCGCSQEECLSQHDKKLAVHHVDGDKSNTSLSNLISLCTSCHVNHHNSGLELVINDRFKGVEF
jgi:DNA-directed RNA polymerase subunit RPC12/RpoP